MDGSNSGGASPADSSFFARLSNCSSCNQRKVYLKTMLSNKHFWVGLVAGVGVTYVWHMYSAKKG